MTGKHKGFKQKLGLVVALLGVGGASLFAEGGLELTGRIAPSDPGRSAGGSFVVESVGTQPESSSSGKDLVLRRTGSTMNGGGDCACLSDSSIFTDGFESGDTSAWSSTTP